MVVHGLKDEIFPENGVRESYEIIRRMYEAAGVPERCRPVSGDGGHRFYADAAWRAAHELLDG